MTSPACAYVSPARRLVVTVTLLMLTLAAIAASATTALGADAQPESPATSAAGPAGIVTASTGSSCDATTSLSNYSNGLIPLAALCQLRAAPGQYLRADAAYNFNRMSAAYARTFKTPICVTDSYRTLKSQQELYKTKPKLAAVPGRSRHGLGIATDLCGGIQTFSTAQHVWMFQNAPLYRWVHPSWAQASGSRPEAWHFEFQPASTVVKQALAAARALKAKNSLDAAKDVAAQQAADKAAAQKAAADKAAADKAAEKQAEEKKAADKKAADKKAAADKAAEKQAADKKAADKKAADKAAADKAAADKKAADKKAADKKAADKAAENNSASQQPEGSKAKG